MDWLHQGEIIGSDDGTIYPSPDGSKVAFAEFDNTNVRKLKIPLYGDPYDPYTNQYPGSFTVPYPKSGANIPMVNLYVYNAEVPGDIPLPVRPPREMDVFSDGIIYTAAKFISNG